MKASRHLKADHRSIKSVLRVMDAVCTRLEEGHDVDPDHLEQRLDFPRGFVDEYHHVAAGHFRELEDLARILEEAYLK
jgi:hemerythrin-like domain-containing protein